MNLTRGPLVVVHAVFATVVVISFSIYLRERENDVAHVKQIALQERQDTARLHSARSAAGWSAAQGPLRRRIDRT